MGCVAYVTDVQVNADSLDIIFYLLKHFGQIYCRINKRNKLVKNKKLKFSVM